MNKIEIYVNGIKTDEVELDNNSTEYLFELIDNELAYEMERKGE